MIFFMETAKAVPMTDVLPVVFAAFAADLADPGIAQEVHPSILSRP